MALLVWLPLNGNLDNYGVSNINNITGTNTSFVDGKIGKCCKMGYTSDFTIPAFDKAKQISIAYWCKVNTVTSSQWLDMFHFKASDGTNTYWCRQELYSNCTYSGYFADAGGSINTIPCTVGEWIHYAITLNFATGEAKVYKNGILFNQNSNINTSYYILSTNFRLGENGLDLSQNDFRIYDHILSPKEVKEISKGLVCHYPLNQLTSINNTVRNATYGTYNNFTNVGATGSVATTGKTYDGCVVYRLTFTPTADCLSHVQTTLHGHGIMGFRTTFLANTKYCFWILYRPISHPDTICGGTASNIGGFIEIPPAKWSDDWMVVGQYRNGSVTSDKTDNIFVSFKTPSATAGTPITIEFCCPHLVVGVQDILPEYDYQGNNPTIEYDASGYCNHGTRNGSLVYSSDTPRYSVSTNFTGDSSTFITIPAMILDMTNITFSVWTKWSSFNTWSRVFDFGEKTSGSGYAFLVANNASSALTVAGRLSGGASLPDTTIQNISLNTWYHIVVTLSGTECKTYLNGTLVKTFNLNGLMSTATPFNLNYLGKSNWSADKFFAGNISDFRIYATVLSESDIKELYNQPISFNKHSTMIQGEFIEK